MHSTRVHLSQENISASLLMKNAYKNLQNSMQTYSEIGSRVFTSRK